MNNCLPYSDALPAVSIYAIGAKAATGKASEVGNEHRQPSRRDTPVRQ